MADRLKNEFFVRDVLIVAPELLGKELVMVKNNEPKRFRITDLEAYRGSEDKACHASKGRTPRTEVMFREGGVLYVYLIYGLFWMLNIVAGAENDPQAVLIRGVENCTGPGRVSKLLGIDASYKGEDLTKSGRIWIEDTPSIKNYNTGIRIGVDYAGEYWKSRPWRYFI